MVNRKKIPNNIRVKVLTEAGFRCAVPTCNSIIAIDLHHIVHVSDGGLNKVDNLLALCPTCHALYHKGVIPHESIRAWKLALSKKSTYAYYNKLSMLDQHERIQLSKKQLRILYFHSSPRSSGFDYLSSPMLVKELEQRGHTLRFCWAIHPPLNKDYANVSKDLLPPDAIRAWQPEALVFEKGLFIDAPRIPATLLDELEGSGAIAIIAIPASEYKCHQLQYDSFLEDRGINVPQAEMEAPKCYGNPGRGIIRFSQEQLSRYSIAGDQILKGVSSVVLGDARPIEGASSILLEGQDNVFVKAYHNEKIHGITYPTLAFLNDQDFRTEAVFLSNILFDYKDENDNAIYISNLIEWLYAMRSSSLRQGADSIIP